MITLLDQGLERLSGRGACILGFALLSACGAMLHPGIDIMLRITKAERAFQRFLVTTGKPLEWLCA